MYIYMPLFSFTKISFLQNCLMFTVFLRQQRFSYFRIILKSLVFHPVHIEAFLHDRVHFLSGYLSFQLFAPKISRLVFYEEAKIFFRS